MIVFSPQIFLIKQVLTCIDSLHRVSEVKSKGGFVAPRSVAPSLLMPAGKVSKNDAVTRPPVVKPDGNSYERGGRDVVNAKS